MPHRPVSQIIQGQKVVTAPPGTSVRQAAQLMSECHVGAVMVVERNRLVGVFTERDALFRVLAAGRDANATTLKDVMTPDPLTIASDKPFAHALHMMYEGGFRHVPVVEDGKPVGMVSARDALGPEMKEFEDELTSREHIAEILG